MPQLLLRGFPDGAIRMGLTFSVLKKAGRVTYFVGSGNFYSHPASDLAGPRFAIATLIANVCARPANWERRSVWIGRRKCARCARRSRRRPNDPHRSRRVHSGAGPAHDKAIAALLPDLTQTAFRHPEISMRSIYQLARKTTQCANPFSGEIRKSEAPCGPVCGATFSALSLMVYCRSLVPLQPIRLEEIPVEKEPEVGMTVL